MIERSDVIGMNASFHKLKHGVRWMKKEISCDGVTTISRLLKIISLFCRI